MTEEAVKESGTPEQAALLLEANWRETLPPEFRPVAERHGQIKFTLAYNIGSANEAIALLHRRCKNNAELNTAIQFLIRAMNMLAEYSLQYKGMDYLKLAEIQKDIEIAAQLSAATRQQEGGRIILPH